MLGRKPKLKENFIDKNIIEAEEQFIFYDYNKEKKCQQKDEIQAVLNSNNCLKVMVIIDRKSTLDYLCMKIAEQMEKFGEYANLEGLKAINLTKKTEKGIIKIPCSGELKDYLNGGDVIYCDLTTQEYWVKTNIKIFSNYSKMNINLELKFRLETMFKKLKFLLMKLGINFWIDYSKNKDDPFHYTFINAKFKTTKSKNNFEFNISDLNKTMQIESMRIKDVFDFYSEINCHVNLVPLEELLFNELKNATLEANSMNKLRLNEFREMSFENLISDKKFIPEKNFIMAYIRKIVKSTSERSLKSFYIYNKNYCAASTKNDIIDDEEFINSINEEESANLIIGPEIENELLRDTEGTFDRKFSNTSLKKEKKTFLTVTQQDDNGNIIDINENQILNQENDHDHDHDHDHENVSNNTLDKYKDFKSRANKSFLEHSRIIHEFQKCHDSFIETKENTNNYKINSKDKGTQASMDDSVLLVNSTKPKRNFSNIEIKSNDDKEFILNLNSKHLNESIDHTQIEDSLLHENEISIQKIKQVFPRNVNSQKFSSIFSKMRDTSKYSNLCAEFRIYLKSNRFLDIIGKESTLKLSKNTLERVCIPQFRDVNIQSEAIDVETRNYTMMKDEDDGPISVNNKRILIFISVLISIFITAILFIFLSN